MEILKSGIVSLQTTKFGGKLWWKPYASRGAKRIKSSQASRKGDFHMKVTEVLNVWFAIDRSKKVVVIMILIPKRGKTRKAKGKVNFRSRTGTFWEKVQIPLQCCHIR